MITETQDNTSPVVLSRRNIILDLGRMGYDLFEYIDDVISNAVDDAESSFITAMGVYQSVIENLVRVLAESPDVAIQKQMVTYPDNPAFQELTLILDPSQYEKVVAKCQEYSVRIYLDWVQHLQHHYQGSVDCYLPVHVDRSCVVVKEIVTEYIEKDRGDVPMECEQEILGEKLNPFV